jgi:hypothetical protein
MNSKAIMLLTACIMLVIAAGCSSGPSQAPEAFVKDFMGKHIKMLDAGVADFYIPSEKNNIIQEVNFKIAEKEKEGKLNSLKSAKVDVSGLNIEVLDKKDTYVNDESHVYVKVKVTGKYTIDFGKVTREIAEDETFILRADGGNWKVTETENPWS